MMMRNESIIIALQIRTYHGFSRQRETALECDDLGA